MKFVVDENLPEALVGWLVDRGHEAEHVRTIGLQGKSDSAIWAELEARGAFVLSRDADFLERDGRSADAGAIGVRQLPQRGAVVPPPGRLAGH